MSIRCAVLANAHVMPRPMLAQGLVTEVRHRLALNLNDREWRVRRLLRQPCESQPQLALLKLHRCSCGKKSCRLHLRRQRANRQDDSRLIERKPLLRGRRPRPPIYMHVQRITAARIPCVITPPKTPALALENGTAISLEPPTHLGENLHRRLWDRPIRLGTYVEEIVTALSCAIDEISQHRPRCLPVVIRRRIPPTVIQCHARLPGVPRLVGLDV